MINVDFTTNSGETVYSYSWQNCGGNKNVNFALENPSYTWCTVTHTPENSKVKIHADAVPERQRDPRSAKVLMKVNDVTCDEYFYVSQPGQPCGCSAFTPIEIGATFPSSGAAVGTVIGSYYNDTTCDASKITITGDLQAGAVGGQIKLTSAVGAYNDGRTFNVIFNYDGSECTRGTCTQSAASCRCTTITATPYTFTAVDECEHTREATVLTIDGCCSIETGITGTDSDKFTVLTGTSGSNSIVKVCPKSQNTSTSTDRTATVSVTATCGNDTCSSSTTITQEHSGCTPSVCTCYTVSNASVVDGSNLTCESTSATVRWNFTGYTITKNADCTTAKTQVVSSASTTVNFLPNTGGETSVTRSGETEWYNHLACVGNTCGQSNVKVPWTVELPACVSCGCDNLKMMYSPYIPRIPASGVGNTYRTVWRVYWDAAYFPESCINKITIGEPIASPSNPMNVPGDAMITAYTGTYHPAPGVDVPAIITDIKIKNLAENPHGEEINRIQYPFYVNGKECFKASFEQQNNIPCTCEYFVQSGLMRPIKTHIVNTGTNGQLVMVASGNTHGCGTLSAYTNQTDMINSFSAQTENVIKEGAVVDVNYKWWASFTNNGGDGTGLPRSCSLSFTYTDSDGVVQECSDHFVIEQNSDVCPCPTLAETAYTVNVNGKKQGTADEYGNIDPLSIGIISTNQLTEYSAPNNGYMCQFILADSDSSWCSAYTRYYDYINETKLFILADRNDNDSPRTAIIDCFAVTNAVSGSGVNTTIKVFRPGAYYSKAWSDEHCTYDVCQHVATVTLTQAPFGNCDCLNSDFGIIGGTGALTARTDYDETSYTWSFYRPTCGEATYDYHFEDINHQTIPTPSWITSVAIGDTPYDDAIYFGIEFEENTNGSEDTEARTVYIVFTMNLTDTAHGGQYTCNENLTLIQQGTCTCDKMIVASWISVDYQPHSDYGIRLTAANKCGLNLSNVIFSFEEGYDWISVTKTGLYEYDGYIYISVNISENETAASRTAFYTVTIDGTECTKRTYISQGLSPCKNCTRLMGDIILYNPLYFDYDEYGTSSSTRIAMLPNPNTCDVVSLDYSYSGQGSTNWVSAGTDSDGSIYVTTTGSNTSADNRIANVVIKPLDSGGQVINDCYGYSTVVQYGTGTVQCDCDSLTNDGNYLHITAGTLVGNVYQVSVSPGQQDYVIGYIRLDSELPSCLEYSVTNTQASTVEMRIEEDSSYGSRRYYKLIINVNGSACGTASSNIIRHYGSQTCWSQTIEFIDLPQC